MELRDIWELEKSGINVLVSIKKQVCEDSGEDLEEDTEMYFDGYKQVYDIIVVEVKDGKEICRYTETGDIDLICYCYNGTIPELRRVK